MPTLTSGWMANDRVRFVCDYTVTKTNGGLDATMSATLRVETRYSITDTSNSWAISGSLGSKSGSNLSISHGGSGGTTTIGSVSASGRKSNASVGVSISGIEIYGTISYTFTIPIGALAPYITSFRAANITQTTFTADLVSVVSNGSSMTQSQVQGNTSQSTTGAWLGTGVYADRPVTGLLPGTKYYFRMRVANSGYGWGPWSGWLAFTTLPGVYVRHNGVWRNAIPYVRHNGSWKQATRYVKHNGVWK